MANLEKKGIHPVLAVVANWFVFGVLGYILIGQTNKGIMVLVTTLIGCILCFIPGVIIAVLALVDVYQCADAVEKGEAIDEHQYKNELLFKVCKFLHKDAVFKG